MTTVTLLLSILICAASCAPRANLPVGTWVGGRVPAVVLTDVNENDVSLSEIEGTLQVVNFWAAWCGPCVAEMPSLQTLHDRRAKDGVAVILVNTDEVPEVASVFVSHSGFTFHSLYDRDGAAKRAFHVEGIPLTVIIGPDGRVLDRIVGARKWDAPEMLNKIDGWLR